MNEVSSPVVDSMTEPAQTGRKLADAREVCGLNVADIARQLRLSTWQVEAIETGDYRRLPGPVFVRGFIRNYARLVNLDPAPLLTGAGEQLPGAALPAPALLHSVEIPFPSGRAFHWRRYAVVAFVVFAALGVYEFYPGPPSDTPVAARPIEPSPPQVVAEEKPAAVAEVAQGDSATAQPVRGEAVPAQIEKAESAKAAPAVQPAQAGQDRREHTVRLNFERSAWVEIRDRNGKKIFSQLNPAGTEQSVSGEAPLTLVVGNAASVRLFHNDQRVDLAPHTRVDVARLTLE